MLSSPQLVWWLIFRHVFCVGMRCTCKKSNLTEKVLLTLLRHTRSLKCMAKLTVGVSERIPSCEPAQTLNCRPTLDNDRALTSAPNCVFLMECCRYSTYGTCANKFRKLGPRIRYRNDRTSWNVQQIKPITLNPSQTRFGHQPAEPIKIRPRHRCC